MPIVEYVIKKFTVSLASVVSGLLDQVEPTVSASDISQIDFDQDTSNIEIILNWDTSLNPDTKRVFTFTKAELIASVLDEVEYGLEPDDLAALEIVNTDLEVTTRRLFVAQS